MKNSIVFIFVFILSLSFILAQETPTPRPENELRMRYLSVAGSITVNLTRFLGPAEDNIYVFSAPPYIEVTIDQKLGIANVKGIPGWSGSDVIIFKVNKTEEAVLEEGTGATRPLLKIPDSDLVKLFNYGLARDNFDILTKTVGQEVIRNVQARMEHDKVLIMVNKDVELSADISKSPEIKVDILTGNLTATAVEPGLKESEGYLTNTVSFFIYIGIAIVLFFSLKYLIKYLFNLTPRGKQILKVTSNKSTILSKLKQIEHSRDLEEASNALSFVINEFFMRYFYISLSSNPFELNNELIRRNIRGNLKQDIITFFEKYQFGVPTKEIKKAIHELRYLLNQLG